MAEALASPCVPSDTSTYDFTQPQQILSDGVVTVNGGHKLHVNKAYLALHSPFFHSLFYTDRNVVQEVTLGEVGAEDFVELLHVIYPSRQPVSEENVEAILKLAKKFQIQCVVDECEELLLDESLGATLAKKFLLADKYCLPRLNSWCMSQVNNSADAQTLATMEEYGQLSTIMRLAIMEKVMLNVNSTARKKDQLPVYDFSQPSQQFLSDGVVVIGDEREKFHVNKAYLALHSPFFRVLFFSDFSERSQEEVVVEDVGASEFEELLSVIYPSRRPVSEWSVEFLLELADKFHIQCVANECEKFLQEEGKEEEEEEEEESEITLEKKFLLADTYRLTLLQTWCLDQLNSRDELEVLEESEEYEQLSSKGKVDILEKMVGFYGSCREKLVLVSMRSPSNAEKSRIVGCYIDMPELLESEEYEQFSTEVKLALLQSAKRKC